MYKRQSVYFSQYLIPHNGRAVVPKGSVVPDEDSVCLDFVSGDLLDYEIKPLELGPPKYEERLKSECGSCAVSYTHLPSNRIIQEYDMVLLDFGATVNGYASDWTRTFAVGSARQEQLELYRLVWDIERFLIELIRPGITFYQLFDRAYQILEGHTYAPVSYTHLLLKCLLYKRQAM